MSTAAPPSSILLVPPSPPSLLIDEAPASRAEWRLVLRGFLHRHGPMVVVLLLTIVGGAIRFTRLSSPCLWGDEANVYMRSIGKYADMLGEIRDQGFGPLHYELYWLILRSVRHPGPWVMRAPPAICGTLMIPAMYFLARQLLPRRTALAAAAITAFSGFLIFYSRDAKMYSENWLFLTISAGGLLWWFRRRTLLAWLVWVSAGCISCGIHASALAIVGISPLLLLTQSHVHWRTGLAWLIGALIILAGPVGYYTMFNRWNTNVEEEGWRHSGIEWVEEENAGRSGPDLIRCTATSFLMGWTWPRVDDVHEVDALRFQTPRWCADLLFAVMVATLVPWPLRERPPRRGLDAPPHPQWRVFLWLGIWIGLCGYGFYCRSMAGFEGPGDWWDAAVGAVPARFVGMIVAHHWVGYLLGIAMIAGLIGLARAVPSVRPTMVRGVQWILAAAVLVGVCAVIYHVCAGEALKAEMEDRPWQSIWMPRYLGFILPAVAMGAAALVMRLPTRPIRAAALIVLLSVNLAFGLARIFGNTEPPTQQMAADAFLAQPSDSVVRTYFDILHGDGRPGEGTIYAMPGHYYLQLLAQKRPMTPGRFMGLISEFRFRGRGEINEVVSDVHRDPGLRRIIIWDDVPLKIAAATDKLSPRLKRWRLVRENVYPVRDFWTWQNLAQYRRREYQYTGSL